MDGGVRAGDAAGLVRRLTTLLRTCGAPALERRRRATIQNVIDGGLRLFDGIILRRVVRHWDRRLIGGWPDQEAPSFSWSGWLINIETETAIGDGPCRHALNPWLLIMLVRL